MNYLDVNYNRLIDYFEKFKSDNLGFYFSFFLHFIILISAIGLPNFFEPKQIQVPTIIPIEIINVTNVTSIPKEELDIQSFEIKSIKVKEKKFNSSDNQDIKKIDIKKKPKIKENLIDQKIALKEKEKKIINEKKIITELDKVEKKIDINNFESLPVKKIRPKLKPNTKVREIDKLKKTDVVIEAKPKPQIDKLKKTDVVIEAKPKPQIDKLKKTDVVIEAKPKPQLETEFNIASMLKDLRNEKNFKNIKSEIEEKSEDIIDKNKEEIISEVAQLSISEIDLVLQQLSRCFISPAGAEIKKTMFVKISAKIQPNRKVYENSIRIVDTNISKSSPVYGPITESAMRTLLNPDCIPLKLPEDKYELWRNLTMKFDYSVMRGN